MKRSLFSVFMLAALSATAQSFKPFKVNLSLGMAKPLSSGVSGGVLFAVEPKYGLGDHVDLGLRIESALVARELVTQTNSTTGKAGAFGSILFTSTFLFGTGNTRPFIGFGAGLYRIGSSGTVTVYDGQSPKDIVLDEETKPGGMVRAGLKMGHLVLAAEYSAAPTTTRQLTNTTINSKNAYLGIKLGVDLGGGRR